MATGDVTVWNGYMSTGDEAFQPSSGVQMNIKTCAGTYHSTTSYITLENNGGYAIRRTDADGNVYAGAIGEPSGFDGGDQVEFFCNILVTNSAYIQFDGTGAGSKDYYVSGIQTD